MGILESCNLFPECVSMQLETVPTSSSSEKKEQFDLYLTINFNKQWKSLLDGRVEFSLKGGTLKLNLENGEFTLEKSISCQPLAIFPTFSQKKPFWRFSLKPGESVLTGALEQTKLGTLIAAENFRLEATFTVSKADISLTNAEDLWKHDISPNKHGILERAIALYLLNTHFKPYLSLTKLGFNNFSDRQPSIVKEDESKLQQLIDCIYEAPTDNFLELAKLAELNPLEDLTGGNFLAANLSGITFNSADLSRSNFRGAVLTDADLSEANLNHAKLNGADLSGVYLENADLSYADLHNASLALGNAIAANFTGANLVGANLSKTNFSGAIVLQAKFGENPGLADEVKQSLKERGAIVE
jgi:uncharacterized protein YjbI with pentapeptide repeats